jgi:hypothetical protein
MRRRARQRPSITSTSTNTSSTVRPSRRADRLLRLTPTAISAWRRWCPHRADSTVAIVARFRVVPFAKPVRLGCRSNAAPGHVQFVPHKNKTKERTMHKHIIAAILAATISSGAMAQADTGSHNPAVKNPTVHTTAMAAKGHNSFTESQARGRIAKDGYTDVSKLTKNANGVWEGTAMKAGAKVKVALDYKGNVTTH